VFNIPLPPVPIQIVLLLLVIPAALYDILYRRIPNWLTLAGTVAGLTINLLVGGLPGVRESLLGLLLGFTFYFLLYLLRGMGAGDVKLMAAVGAIAGPAAWLRIFILTAFLAGFFGFLLASSKGRLKETLSNFAFMLHQLAFFRAPHLQRPDLDVRNPERLRMPHGAAAGLGCILYLAIMFARS
jgi:prepilin peptidase CpaA